MSARSDGDILVTALIAAYNHAPYIAAAIDSALAQVTSFPLEILICEDASTDATPAIVADYESRFPDRVRVIRNEHNLGGNGNVARGLRLARGRFVALLDADDFWTAPDKLERQAAHLLQHPECAAHFFNARIMRDELATEELWTPPAQAARATLADIWHGNPYPTAGSMLRRIEVPNWYDRLNLTDWPLYVLAATGGELHFDPAPAACYRLHADGAFSGLTDRQKLKRTDEFYRQMDRHLAGRFRRLARAGRSHLFHDWARAYLDAGKLPLAGKAWRMSLAAGVGPGTIPLASSLRLGWRIAGRSLAP